MSNYNIILKKFSLFFIFIFFSTNIIANAEEEKLDAVIDQLQILTQDLKTLEKAVYKTAEVSNSQGSISANGLNEEILTRHLLKLNEIEEEFRKLTNRFEEVNFKLDNLSSRVTKIQSDAQLRFSDLESVKINPNTKAKNKKTVKNKTSKRLIHGPHDFELSFEINKSTQGRNKNGDTWPLGVYNLKTFSNHTF